MTDGAAPGRALADADFLVDARPPRYNTQIMCTCFVTGTNHLDLAADNDLGTEIDLDERFRRAGLGTGPSSASRPGGEPARRNSRGRERGDR